MSRVLAVSVASHPRVTSAGVALLAALVGAASLIHPAAALPLWLAPGAGRWLEAPRAQVWLAVPLRVSVPADAPLANLPTYLGAAGGTRGLVAGRSAAGSGAAGAGGSVAAAPGPDPGDGGQAGGSEAVPQVAAVPAGPEPAAGGSSSSPLLGFGDGDPGGAGAGDEPAPESGAAYAGGAAVSVRNWPARLLQQHRGPLRVRTARR